MKVKIVMKAFILLVFVCLMHSGNAQKKSKSKTKEATETKMEVPPPEELGEVKISALIDAPPTMEIDFDTTAAPQDAFTDSIRRLLLITDAKGKDLAMGEKALRQTLGYMLENPETKEMGEKFINRFVLELKEGRASRWMENVYIRNYRALFTIEEVHDLIVFYQTPAGRKTLERSMLLLEAISTEARKIGAYLGPKIMNELMKDGNNK